jgi:DNA-binding NarL/FixJ family response regulator
MPKIRLMVIEDNRIFRKGIIALINGSKDMKVIVAVDGNHDIIKKARAAKPNVALMDFSLNNQTSFDIVKLLKKELPGIKIIGMDLVPTQADILEFVEAGADGFILKDATMKEMLNTVRSVATGKAVLPPPMTGSLLFQVAEHALSKEKKNLRGAVRMTQREKEIIALIANGMSNKQIAGKLNISPFTVKSHVHNILEKLALQNRFQIAEQIGGE